MAEFGPKELLRDAARVKAGHWGKSISAWDTAIQDGFVGKMGRVGNIRMMNTPPALMVTARICSIVKGFFHVSANLRLFSRRVWSLESTYAIVAMLLGDMVE